MTPSPEVERGPPDPTPFNPDQQIYEPEVVVDLGVIDPDLGVGGSIGPRCIGQLFIDLQGEVAPPGAKVVVAAQRDATFTELYGVLDLAGKTTASASRPFVVPQGSVIQMIGVEAGADPILVRVSIETPADPCMLQAWLALVEAAEGDGNDGCPCLRLASEAVTEAGSFQIDPGGIQPYDASALADDEMRLVLPGGPALHQEAGIKEVGDSFVTVIVDGNGNDVETLTDAPSASHSTGIARQSLTWQFDGVSTWRLI